MAYFVQGAGNLKYKISEILENHFGDKAEVKVDSYGKLSITFKEDAGFKNQEDRLSDKEIEMGVCGGGFIEGLDGKTFFIQVEERKEG